MPPGDGDHVVGHQPMPALHQVERALRFADRAPPGEHEPDSVHIHQRAVDHRLRGEDDVEIGGELMDERGGGLGGAENRHLLLIPELDRQVGDVEPLRHDDARDGELEQALDRLVARLIGERGQVPDLGLAEDLDALEEEVLLETGQDQARAVDVGDGDVIARLKRFGEDLEVQVLALVAVKLLDGQAIHRRSLRVSWRARSARSCRLRGDRAPLSCGCWPCSRTPAPPPHRHPAAPGPRRPSARRWSPPSRGAR